MALYIGNTKVTAYSNLSANWFGGNNAELLYTATANYALDSFLNWETYSATPLTAATLVYAVTSYSTASAVTVIFDRYGNGYHDGEILDFTHYDYFKVNECVIDAVYDGVENTFSAAHPVSGSRIVVHGISKAITGNTATGVVYPNQTAAGTTTVKNIFDQVSLLCRSNTNTLFVWSSNTAGFIIANNTPTFSTSNTSLSTYINFRTPTLRMITLATTKNYFSTTAFNLLDPTQTLLKIRQLFYRTNKNNVYTNGIDRIGYMLNNKNFTPN